VGGEHGGDVALDHAARGVLDLALLAGQAEVHGRAFPVSA
jgi:hypothetical protein